MNVINSGVFMKKLKNMFILFVISFLPLFSVSAANKVNCGNVTNIPSKIPELTSLIVTILQIAVPIILVIMGSIDFLKAVSAQKEDEIKKGQSMFIKRLIVAVLVFFIVAITKLVISLVSDATNTNNMVECIDCFISGECERS